MPIERMNGSGRTTIESRPTATVEPGDDHRATGVRHRLHERRLDVLALAQLVAEAEDHQQRVVDRDAQPDERDQELDDDRDVRDVGERPDERERVQDRRHRDRDAASGPRAACRRRRGGSRSRRGRRSSPRRAHRPPPPPCVLASSSGSCPVTSTVDPGGQPALRRPRARPRRRSSSSNVDGPGG